MMQIEQETDSKNKADQLGITCDEFQQLDYYLEDEKCKDGSYRSFMVFRNSSPNDILQKINGLTNNNKFYLDPDPSDD